MTALALFLAVTAIAVGAFIAGARLLSVPTRAPSRLRLRPYECGEETEGATWIRFHPRYYVIALCFLVFDVEAIFLFPWALQSRGAGWAGVAAVALFVLVLLAGWWYALRKKALRWQ